MASFEALLDLALVLMPLRRLPAPASALDLDDVDLLLDLLLDLLVDFFLAFLAFSLPKRSSLGRAVVSSVNLTLDVVLERFLMSPLFLSALLARPVLDDEITVSEDDFERLRFCSSRTFLSRASAILEDLDASFLL